MIEFQLAALSYGDPWGSFFYYLFRFLLFALTFFFAGAMIGGFVWARKGTEADLIEEDNDRLLRELHKLRSASPTKK